MRLKKASITNRLGDFGFMPGILTVFAIVGSLNFATIQEQQNEPTIVWRAATLAGLR